MSQSQDRLSTQLQKILGDRHQQLLRDIAQVESAAEARSIAVIRNHRFPYWSLERWMSVLTLVTFIGGISAGIFFWGSQWQYVYSAVTRMEAKAQSEASMESELRNLRFQMTVVQDRLDKLTAEAGEISESTRRQRAESQQELGVINRRISQIEAKIGGGDAAGGGS